MRIGSREIGHRQPPYVIAEIGVNHDGSIDRAIELADAARRAGADAVKFQCFRADLLLSRAARLAAYQREAGAADPFEMLRSLELSIDDLIEAARRAQSIGLHAIVTVFSVELVGPASRFAWDAYKTASPDIINRPLLDALLAARGPLILSTGAADVDEVERAIDWIDSRAPFALMQCVSAYPTPDGSASLGGIGALRELTAAPVGYSDHTPGADTGAMAVCAGACLLEKHLTYDRGARGPDHAASLDPDQFAEYIRLARRAWDMIGPIEKRILPVERDVRGVSRQSLVVTRAIRRGERVARADLTVKRPGGGIEPWRIDEVAGRAAARDLDPDMPLLPGDLVEAPEPAASR